MLWLLSWCLSGVFQGRLPHECGNSWLRAVAPFARVICFQLLKDPVVHSAVGPNREAQRGWTSSGRMKDWRPVIDFFSRPSPSFLSPLCDPLADRWCALKTLFVPFRSSPPPRLSRRKVAVSILKAGEKDEPFSGVRHTAAGREIISWKNWHENDGVITNSFWKKVSKS